MNKQLFEAPRAELILLAYEDVITASGDDGENWGDWDQRP